MTAAARSELLELVQGSLHESIVLDDRTPLISSGLLDSVGLFAVICWVEQQTRREVDATAIDFAAEWDSIGQILSFVERCDSGSPPSVRAAVTPAVSHEGGRLHITRYAPDLESQVAALQTSLWSMSPELNRQYLTWKLEQNPYDRDRYAYVALDGAEVVGMRTFYASRWEVGSAVSDVLVADDLVVRESHRGKAVFSALMDHALDDLRAHGHRYVFNLSGGPMTVLNSLATGWRKIGAVEQMRSVTIGRRLRFTMERALSRIPVLWRLSAGPRKPADNPFDRIAELFDGRRVDGFEIRCSRQCRAADMARLIDECPRRASIRHLRDANFFEWRFRNPTREYIFLYVGSSALDGYLVLRRPHESSLESADVVSIVDVQARNGAMERALLSAVIKLPSFAEVILWADGLENATRGALPQLGFRPDARRSRQWQSRGFLVRATDDSNPDAWRLHGVSLLEWRNWDRRMVYTMHG
jgi:GNAT superfamily N-acetyltransferase